MDNVIDILILRFDAPLMSFGAPVVDKYGVIQPYPALSMMTGMLGNSLGFDHSDTDRLEHLQDRLHYASRQDRKGRKIRDYQTVNLGAEYMKAKASKDNVAWTTRGKIDRRTGGDSNVGTHIRLRDYWADTIHTVALTLHPTDEVPTLDDLEHALQYPARPLFIGRKACLPAAALFVRRAQIVAPIVADGLVEALTDPEVAPLAELADDRPDRKYPMWWPSHPDDKKREGEAIRRPVTDRCDWNNQIHVGERWVANGKIEVIKDDKSDV